VSASKTGSTPAAYWMVGRLSNRRMPTRANFKGTNVAKVAIEIEDQPNGELRLHFVVDGMRTALKMESNTAA